MAAQEHGGELGGRAPDHVDLVRVGADLAAHPGAVVQPGHLGGDVHGVAVQRGHHLVEVADGLGADLLHRPAGASCDLADPGVEALLVGHVGADLHRHLVLATEAAGLLALQGHLGLAGDEGSRLRRWDVPAMACEDLRQRGGSTGEDIGAVAVAGQQGALDPARWMTRVAGFQGVAQAEATFAATQRRQPGDAERLEDGIVAAPGGGVDHPPDRVEVADVDDAPVLALLRDPLLDHLTLRGGAGVDQEDDLGHAALNVVGWPGPGRWSREAGRRRARRRRRGPACDRPTPGTRWAHPRPARHSGATPGARRPAARPRRRG